MRTAIVYYSKHHGNTKKLLDAIAAADENVTLIDVTECSEADLSSYDRIGFASGIYYSAFAKKIREFAEAHLPEEKDVFFYIRFFERLGSQIENSKKICFGDNA